MNGKERQRTTGNGPGHHRERDRSLPAAVPGRRPESGAQRGTPRGRTRTTVEGALVTLAPGSRSCPRSTGPSWLAPQRTPAGPEPPIGPPPPRPPVRRSRPVSSTRSIRSGSCLRGAHASRRPRPQGLLRPPRAGLRPTAPGRSRGIHRADAVTCAPTVTRTRQAPRTEERLRRARTVGGRGGCTRRRPGSHELIIRSGRSSAQGPWPAGGQARQSGAALIPPPDSSRRHASPFCPARRDLHPRFGARSAARACTLVTSCRRSWGAGHLAIGSQRACRGRRAGVGSTRSPDRIRPVIWSITSQAFTFIPTTTRPWRSQNAMSCRACRSPRMTARRPNPRVSAGHEVPGVSGTHRPGVGVTPILAVSLSCM